MHSRVPQRAEKGATLQAAIAPAPAITRGAPSVLSASGLTREYGVVLAVAGIDLELGAGDFLTIFGPNGAGKTSLLSLLGGRLKPSSGEIRVGGERLDFTETSWRSRIGVLSHQSFLYAHLTVAENLRFFGRLFGLRDLDERIPQRLEQVGLSALARALVHDPEVVLLDEPYTGLGPYAASVLRGVLSSLKDGNRTVVMVTHNLTQGLAMANRIAIQVRGRFSWEGARSEVEPDAFEHFYHQVVEAGGR